MTTSFDTHYFLGANTGKGFFSLYDNFVDTDDGDFLYVIKGGPGCGKSTFMKTIAKNLQENGIFAEYIHCSGDPASLDGVYFPKLKTAFVDGTAPHVIEPDYSGAAGTYINIGQFYDSSSLRELLPQIRSNSIAYKALYKKAYTFLAGAAAISEKSSEPIFDSNVKKVISKRVHGIAAREFKKATHGKGKVTKRFLSAISCDGLLSYFDTVNAMANRVYVLENNLGLAPYMLDLLQEQALIRGYDVIICPSPLLPEFSEHIIIPELSLAFISQTVKSRYPYDIARHIRLDDIPENLILKTNRSKIKKQQKIYDSLITEALSILNEAGHMHDELESIYNPFVDFNGVISLAHEYTDKLQKAL